MVNGVGYKRARSWFLASTSALCAVLLSSCSGGGDAFSFLEDGNSEDNITSAVEIVDFTPKSDPVIITHSGTTTFAVTVGSGAGNNLSYSFMLNGVLVQKGPNGFYDLPNLSVGAGDHQLDVEVTNGLTKDSHRFNLSKNTAPVVDNTSPTAGGNNVSCGGGSLVLTVEASDHNGDALDFTWKFNSAVFPAAFSSIVTTDGQSVATFSPACVLSGAGTVTVEVSDGFDVVTHTWSVNIINPITAQITSYTPSIFPVIIPSSGSQLFSVNALGKAPITYSWHLDGTPVGGASSSFYTLTAGSLSVGPHVLTARVEDSDSFDEQVFNVVRNAPPDLTNPDPPGTDLKMNYQSTKTYRIDASDLNGDTLTYSWTVDGSVSGALLDSPTATGSQAVFSPGEALVGAHTIRVRVSDGTEHTDHQWAIEVNYMSDACNNLAAGQICTLVGRVGLGSGQVPGSTPEVVNIHPSHVVHDGSAGVFASDQANHIVWYQNLSGAAVTRLGVLIEPGQIVALVGNGASGSTPNGSKNNLYKLYRPEGLAWDPVTESLFIAQYSARVVSRVDSSGAGMRVACRGTNSNEAPEDGAALDHGCPNPTALALDTDRRILYLSNATADHYIRAFDISDSDPAEWTGSVLVRPGNGANGTLGSAGTARVDGAWAMSVDSRGVLYWIDGGSNCRLRVANTTAGAISFFGGALAVSVPAGQTASLTGGGCGNGEGTLADTGFGASAKGLSVVESSPGVVKGWFASNTAGHRVLFVNNSASAVTYGGTEITGYTSGLITAGSNGFNGNLLGRLTRVNQPNGVSYFPAMQVLLIGDYNNSRLRLLDLSGPSGFVTTLAGEDFKYGNSGDGGKAPQQVIMRNPRGVTVDKIGKLLYVTDMLNGRIRMLDLISGWVTTALGIGRSNASAGANPIDPGGAYSASPGLRGVFALTDGNLLYTDQQSGTGAGMSCVVRMSNFMGLPVPFLGTTVPAGRIATVAGDWSLGCGYHNNGGLATSSQLYAPEDVIYDGTNAYISFISSHCLAKVDPSGEITTLTGDCETAGYVDGQISDPAVRLRSPTSLALDPVYAEAGNFFFVDAYNSGTSYLRYVNQRSAPVEISGIVIPAGSVGTVVTSGSSHRIRGVAAFDSQYCFTKSVSGPHNVTCRNRYDDLQNTTLRVGSSDASPVAAGAPLGDEQEGVSASNATLFEPYGLAFDHEGNLYIVEYDSHQIRKVRRWW